MLSVEYYQMRIFINGSVLKMYKNNGGKRLTKMGDAKKRDNNNRNHNDNMECDDVMKGCSVILSNKARQTTKEHTLHNRFAHTQISHTQGMSAFFEPQNSQKKRMWYFYPLVIISKMLSASDIEFYLLRHESNHR